MAAAAFSVCGTSDSDWLEELQEVDVDVVFDFGWKSEEIDS